MACCVLYCRVCLVSCLIAASTSTFQAHGEGYLYKLATRSSLKCAPVGVSARPITPRPFAGCPRTDRRAQIPKPTSRAPGAKLAQCACAFPVSPSIRNKYPFCCTHTSAGCRHRLCYFLASWNYLHLRRKAACLHHQCLCPMGLIWVWNHQSHRWLVYLSFEQHTHLFSLLWHESTFSHLRQPTEPYRLTSELTKR